MGLIKPREALRAVCDCGLETKRNVTSKGNNIGREFVACSKGKKEYGGCAYFAWVDQCYEEDPSEIKQAPKSRFIGGTEPPRKVAAPEAREQTLTLILKHVNEIGFMVAANNEILKSLQEDVSIAKEAEEEPEVIVPPPKKRKAQPETVIQKRKKEKIALQVEEETNNSDSQ